jgi:hypothetical protein
MLCTLYSQNMLVACPLQVLPDQTAVFAPEAAAKLLQQAEGPDTSGKKKRKIHREMVTATLVASTHALMQMVPFPDLLVYRPSAQYTDLTITKRIYCEREGQYYMHNTVTKASTWCLSQELAKPGRQVRILNLACDEGAPGFVLFNFLAGPGGLRCLFHRDGPHRLTGVFINSLRGVPEVLQVR